MGLPEGGQEADGPGHDTAGQGLLRHSEGEFLNQRGGEGAGHRGWHLPLTLKRESACASPCRVSPRGQPPLQS